MKRKEVEKILKEYGYTLIRSNKHMIYSNGKISVAVPNHMDYSRGLTRRILQQAMIDSKVIKELV